MSKEKNKRGYFTFYRSFYEQISDCNDPEARREMYEVLLDYAFNKTEPDFNAGTFNPITKFFWIGAKPVMAKNWAQYENGCRGGAPMGNTNNKGKKKVNPKLTQNQTYIDKDKEEEDKDIDIEGEREEDVFRPPALEDVLFYYSSTRGADGDGQARKFFNYYAARGWKMSNGATMADWRAAFDSWCNREKEFNHIQHTCNNENDKPTSEQRGTGFRQLQEQPNRETGLNGQGTGIDDAVW